MSKCTLSQLCLFRPNILHYPGTPDKNPFTYCTKLFSSIASPVVMMNSWTTQGVSNLPIIWKILEDKKQKCAKRRSDRSNQKPKIQTKS